MDKTPLVSFISINYNGIKDTCELIDSIHNHIKSVDYEIIIIDNASKNNEAYLISERYSEIKVIHSEHNLGFSGGNNLGINQAKGEYLFLINNDTYITCDKINYLIKRLNSSNNIGGVSPKIKFAYPPQNIQYAGFTALTPISLRNQTIGYEQTDKPEFNIAMPTPYLHGAAMMLKKEIIKEIGLMPEIYFLYYEEIDWCTQITRFGYELWYEPEFTIFHKESQSTGKESPLFLFYMTRNRLLYAWRNFSGQKKYLSIIYQICVAVPKKMITLTLHGNFKLITSPLRGLLAFIKLPNKKEN